MGYNFTKTEKKIITAIFVFVWFYLWLRAAYVPFIADEISTFFLYIQRGKFFQWNTVLDANNHILNSALSFLSYSLFGLSELSLRLPNLLFVPVYFYAVYKISKELNSRYLAWFFILTMTVNHFLIEYSALTRGYGISMSMLLASIWFTIQLVKHDSIKYYILCFLSIILYLSANLTLIYTALFTLLIISVNSMIRNSERLKSFFLKSVMIVVLGVVPIFYAISYLFELKESNLLTYGITGSFWHVTVESLSFNSVGASNQLSSFIAAILFIIAIFIGLKKLSKTKSIRELSNPGFIFLILLLSNIVMIISLHYLIGVKYPEDRTGMFLIPLLIGSIFFMIDYAVFLTGKKYLISITLPLLYLPIFFILNLNLSYTLYWKNVSIPKRFYKIVKEKTKQNAFPPTIGSPELYTHLWSMYNYRDDGNCNLLSYADSTTVTDDLLIINYNVNKKLRSLYDSLDFDPLSKCHLLQRKFPAAKKHFGHVVNITTDSIITKKYFKFYEGYINKIPGKEVLVTLSMTLLSSETPFYGVLVLQIFGKKHKLLDVTSIPLNRLKSRWNKPYPNFKYSIKTKPLPENCFTIRVFLMDFYNQPYLIRDGELSAYYYE